MTAAISIEPRSPRPFLVFVAGSATGLVILLLTQYLSETQISFGPWALSGNGSLAVPFIGFPLAIYAGWTYLADRDQARTLAVRIVTYSAGLALGGGVMGVIFALPMCIIAGAMYLTFSRGQVRADDRLLWIAFAISAALGAVPVLGIFGVALLPGSLILLARGKSRAARIAFGALLAVTAVLVVFAAPLLFAGSPPAA
jgi:hypothetical protein